MQRLVNKSVPRSMFSRSRNRVARTTRTACHRQCTNSTTLMQRRYPVSATPRLSAPPVATTTERSPFSSLHRVGMPKIHYRVTRFQYKVKIIAPNNATTPYIRCH